MATTLDSALKRLQLGDADFGAACRPPIHRSLIWCYRKRKKIPRADTAKSMLEALEARGVKMTLDDLLRAPRAASTNDRAA